MIINDFITNLKYIAPQARKKCINHVFKLIGKWILLLPVFLIYTAVAFPLVILTVFVTGGKSGVKDAMDELNPKDYWTMNDIFSSYHLKFRCHKCGEKHNYVATFNEVKNYKDKDNGVWSWYKAKEPKCYSCISKRK